MTLRQVRNYIIGMGVTTVILVVLAFVANSTLSDAVAILKDTTVLQEVVLAVDSIENAMEEERIAAGQYPLTGNPEMLTRIENAQAIYDENWAVLLERRGTEYAVQLAEIEEARTVYLGMLEDVIDAYQANPSQNNSSSLLSAALTYYLQNLDPKFSRFADVEIRTYTEQVEVKSLLSRNLENFSNIVTVTGAIASAVALIMSGLSVITTQRMVQAIQKIVTAANAISRGDLDSHINVEQRGEIGDMANAIERMRTSLKAAIERLRR